MPKLFLKLFQLLNEFFVCLHIQPTEKLGRIKNKNVELKNIKKTGS